MAQLTEEVKTFIVQRLAMYDTPTQVAEAVKEEYGVVIPRQGVQFYDPTVGAKPAKKWVALFEATRKNFRAAVADIPIANKSVRLRRLERMAVAAEQRKNYPLAASLLEQAAKEVGEQYTNRRELTGKDGAALIPEPSLDHLSDADLVALAAKLAGGED